MNFPLIYRPKPIFGLDIGRTSVKVVQIKADRRGLNVSGYGFGHFDKSAAKDGEIIKPDVVASTIKNMFSKSMIGKISTDRVAACLPIAHIYTRILQLPKMAKKDLDEAVRLEAEQYVPLSSQEIYVEHRVLANHKQETGGKQQPMQTVLMVATPKKIVNSYLDLFSSLKLDVTSIEPNMFANVRSVDFNCNYKEPRIIIDFGAQSSDMAVLDQYPLLVSTVSTGGDQITNAIAKTLGLSLQQAQQLKIRYGIGKSRWQAKLAAALEPILSDFANEVQKMMRYYHEHSQKNSTITHIFLVGGGANMPGLSDFLSHLTGIEISICNPWDKLSAKPLQPPVATETTIYATAIGLALKEVYEQ